MTCKVLLDEYFQVPSSIPTNVELPTNSLTNISRKHIYKKSNGKYIIQKTVNHKMVNFGVYDTIEEAKKRKQEYERNGWIPPQPRKWRNIWKVKQGKQYVLHKRGEKLWSCYVPEYALYMRDCLEACDWDTTLIPGFEEKFPEYFTDSCFFYSMISLIEGRYVARDKIDGRLQHVTNSSKRVEDVLWERDLYLEYGDDYQSWAEDTRPNPYYDMELPYFPTRRPRGGLKGQKDYRPLLRELAEAVKNNPEYSYYRLCKDGYLSKCVVTYKNVLKAYCVTVDEFKELVVGGGDPTVELSRPRKIIRPDLSRR